MKGYTQLYGSSYILLNCAMSLYLEREYCLLSPAPCERFKARLEDSPMKTALCPSICLDMPQGHMRLPENDL